MNDYTQEVSQIDRKVVESPDLLGRECAGCGRILAFGFYRKDTSYKDGHVPLCISCEAVPKLSLTEHTARVREMNRNSGAVKAQRWEDQNALELKNDSARQGAPMHHSELFARLQKYVPGLYVTDGRIIGNLAIYQIAGGPVKEWDNKDFRYLFYSEEGVMPEFSQYEMNPDTDVPVREKKRGWRTVLLRCIKMGLLTEEQSNKEFGAATGPASTLWYKTLWQTRQLNTSKLR